jgi:multidrug resistance efflux pump
LVAIGTALISTAVRFSRTAAGPAAPPAPARSAPSDEGREGIVCFGTVDLEHGVASLGPLQPGRVAEVLVTENQEVAQGAELLRLEDATARSRLAEARAAVELAQMQVHQAQEQSQQHRRRVAQQEAMRDVMRSRVAAARLARDRQTELSKSIFISDSDKLISAEKVREAEALERAEQQRLAELEAEDIEDAARRATWELKAAEARYDQAKAGLEECHLKAPCRGTVLRILVEPGDVIGGQPGQAAVLFAPDGPRVIRATIEQEFASRVKEGQPAVAHDEADPSATWHGRVARVAGWYSQHRMVLHDPSQLSDVRTLECVIVLEPGQPRLKLGQSLRVFIGAATR